MSKLENISVFNIEIYMILNKNYDALLNEIEDIINNQGDFGIFASEAITNYSFKYNANKEFFMVSTYKLPIAIHCLKLVENGMLNLEQVITLLPNDQRPGAALPKPLVNI